MVYSIPYTPSAQGTRRTKTDHSVNIQWHQMLARSYARAREYQELYGVDEDDEDELSDYPNSPNFNDSQKAVEDYLEYISALPRRRPLNMPAKDVPNVEEEIPETPSTPRPTNRRWRRYLSIDSAVAIMSPTKLWASARKRTRSLPEFGFKGRSPFARLRRRGTGSQNPVTAVPKRALTRVASEPRLQTQTPVPAILKKARRNTVNEEQTYVACARRAEFATPATPPKQTCSRRERSKSSSPPAPKAEFEQFQIRSMLLPSSVFETTATCPYSIRQSPIPADMWEPLNINIEALIEDEPYQEPWWVTPSVTALLLVILVLIIALCLASVPVWAVCAPCSWVFGVLTSSSSEFEDEKRKRLKYPGRY